MLNKTFINTQKSLLKSGQVLCPVFDLSCLLISFYGDFDFHSEILKKFLFAKIVKNRVLSLLHLIQLFFRYIENGPTVILSSAADEKALRKISKFETPI